MAPVGTTPPILMVAPAFGSSEVVALEPLDDELLEFGAAACSDDGSEERDREADHRAAAEEVPPAQLARDQTVDQVVFQIAAVAAQLIELVRIPFHGRLFL